MDSTAPATTAHRPPVGQVSLSASSLRSVIDRLSARVFAADPTETLKAAGLTDVASYSITVSGDDRHYVTGTTPDGHVLDASAWSLSAAAALVLAQLDDGTAHPAGAPTAATAARSGAAAQLSAA